MLNNNFIKTINDLFFSGKTSTTVEKDASCVFFDGKTTGANVPSGIWSSMTRMANLIKETTPQINGNSAAYYNNRNGYVYLAFSNDDTSPTHESYAVDAISGLRCDNMVCIKSTEGGAVYNSTITNISQEDKEIKSVYLMGRIIGNTCGSYSAYFSDLAYGKIVLEEAVVLKVGEQKNFFISD